MEGEKRRNDASNTKLRTEKKNGCGIAEDQEHGDTRGAEGGVRRKVAKKVMGDDCGKDDDDDDDEVSGGYCYVVGARPTNEIYNRKPKKRQAESSRVK